MRRVTSLFAVTVIMVAMLATSAMPAFAAANPDKANYIGGLASFGNERGPGVGGMQISALAQDGEVGQLASGNGTTSAN